MCFSFNISSTHLTYFSFASIGFWSLGPNTHFCSKIVATPIITCCQVFFNIWNMDIITICPHCLIRVGFRCWWHGHLHHIFFNYVLFFYGCSNWSSYLCQNGGTSMEWSRSTWTTLVWNQPRLNKNSIFSWLHICIF